MPANIYSLAPINVSVNGGAAVVIPCNNHAFSPDIISNPYFHSGNLSPNIITTPGANPRVTASMPFEIAFDTFGLNIVKLTAFDLYLSKYADFIRMSGANHAKLALTAGAYVAAQVTDWSVDQDGILMAEVSFDLLSDDQVHPEVFSTGNALPTLLAQPVLHTLGPAQINGVVIPGSTSSGGGINGSTVVQRNDGDLYPRVASRIQVAPTARIAHADPVGVLSALGLLGTSITSATELWFKKYDPTTGVVMQTGGLKIAIGAGRVTPEGWTSQNGAVATSGFNVTGITSDGGSNPFSVTKNVDPPATP